MEKTDIAHVIAGRCDIEFVLYEWFRVADVIGHKSYCDLKISLKIC
ncbi:MAG: hypothetical protein GY874_10680 [Desulfobacteraceae bacterium]|nr:hypothetical protein [Desulfobacteraceae bacterium]